MRLTRMASRHSEYYLESAANCKIILSASDGLSSPEIVEFPVLRSIRCFGKEIPFQFRPGVAANESRSLNSFTTEFLFRGCDRCKQRKFIF